MFISIVVLLTESALNLSGLAAIWLHSNQFIRTIFVIRLQWRISFLFVYMGIEWGLVTQECVSTCVFV